MPRRDAASRLIAATPERVYAALVDPNAWAAWLPPGDMTATIEAFDGRPGGSYRIVLRHRDLSVPKGKTTAGTDVVEGRFVDIVPGVRVVQAVDFVSDDPAYGGTMTMRWELTAAGDETLVEITADDVPPGVSAEDHASGMASSLEKLADYLDG